MEMVFSKVADYVVIERDSQFEVWERCPNNSDLDCFVYHRKMAESARKIDAVEIAEKLRKAAPR